MHLQTRAGIVLLVALVPSACVGDPHSPTVGGDSGHATVSDDADTGATADGRTATMADGDSPAANGMDADADGTGAAGRAADVTATIDATLHYQTMVGFGAALAYYVNLLTDRRVSGDDIYQILFNDLGLDILRIGNWYQNQTETGTSGSTPFSDTATVAAVRSATAALGHTPKILMSSWSPPAYLKSTGDTKNGGTLIKQGGAYAYTQFAQWWVDALVSYANRGLSPDYVSIQNEPDFTAAWETCRFDATEGTNAAYGKALDAVYGAMPGANLASKPEIIGPEVSGIVRNRVQSYMAQVPPGDISAIAHHLYNGGANGADPAPDSFNSAMTGVAMTASAVAKLVFMTEFSPSSPSMFDTAWLIHNAVVVEGAAAYIYWELIWPAPTSGTIPTALVSLESPYAAFATPRGYTINDVYFALKHYARWIDPGWVRVSATSPLAAVKVSAYESPDGTNLTVVLLNTDSSEHAVAISTGTLSFHSVTAYRTSGTSERTSRVGVGAGNVVTLPGLSIATVTLTP